MKKILILLNLAVAALLFLVIWSQIERAGSGEKLSVDQPAPANSDAVEKQSAAVPDAPILAETTEESTVEPELVPLFLSSEKTDFKWTSRTPAARRVRRVFPDPALMSSEPVLQKGEKLELALFDDAVFSTEISRVTRYPNGAVGITAYLEGGGTAYLSYCGSELRGSIEIPGSDDYYVRYDSSTDAHYAIEVDRENSDFLGCGNDIFSSTDAIRHASEHLRSPVEGGEPVAQGDVPGEYPSGTVQIDVMFVYTPAARIEEGGVSGMNINIALAMEKATEAHLNSDTRVYLNLVHSAETTYTETSSSSTDLARLRITNDGYMDDVHTLRDQYNADLVCLLMDRNDVGGLGYLPDDAAGEPGRGFCLARVQQSDWTYTVVHEWGHNMGCGHSKSQVVQPGPGLFNYSAGWQWADTASPESIGYCSVMTYKDPDDDDVYEYERVGHFSNPDIDYTGNSTNPTGHSSNGDNARTIRNVRYVIAGYRGAHDVVVTSFPLAMNSDDGVANWLVEDSTASWTWDKNGTPTSSTGPSSGIDGDYYLYIEASNYSTGNQALLQAAFDFSGVFNPTIDFAYHMYGGAMGSLYLEASVNDGGSWTALWSESGDQGNLWLTNSVSLLAFVGNTNVQLRFRGVVGSDFRSDMALDAIVVDAEAAPVTDIDGDGLPNDWEKLYYSNETSADPTSVAANGVNTVLQAYIAGFDPTDPTAGFNGQLNAANSIVQWNALSGRVYSVYWTDDLMSGFPETPFESGISGGAYTDLLHHADSEAFYRIEVKLEP